MKAVKEIGINKALKYFFYSLWQYLFSAMFISPLRIFLLRISGVRIGHDTVIERVKFMNLYAEGLLGLTIGNRCFLGDGVVLDMADRISLGNDVTLSAETFLLTHTNVGYKNHPLQKTIPRMKGKIKIEKGAFIGVRAMIMPSVTVGELSVVGAYALVNKDVKQHTFVAGIPAKQIKRKL